MTIETIDPPAPSVPAEPAPPPAARRGRRLLGGTARIVAACVLVIAVGAATLAFLKGYVHARRHVTPIIVTPEITAEQVASPPLGKILARMKEMAMVRMGWAPDPVPKLIAFTFDDGPYAQLTPQLLDLLKRHKIHATFFIEGKDAQMQPELVRRIVNDGHELGNHSFTHSSFVGLDEAAITRELQQTDALIRSLTGVATPLMRPPGGRLDASRYRLIHRLGFTVVNDNDNPGDYRESDPLRLYTFTLMHSSRCAIICMHSGRLVTIKALPTIIDAYTRKGYRFATVSEIAKAQGIDIPALPGSRVATEK